MWSGVKDSKGRQGHSSRSRQIIENETMESNAIQTVVTQVAIQAATTAVMVLREADAGPTPGTNAVSLREV